MSSVTPAEAIDAANAIFGPQRANRALHAKGILLAGSFLPKGAATELTRAPVFRGEPVRVTARFSNGAGAPKAPDFLPEVRGLAVKFYLPEEARFDLVAQTAEHFPVGTPEEFVALLRAAAPPRKQKAIGIPRFLATHPRAALRLARNPRVLTPPASFASVPYYAVHAYRWINAAGQRCHVRYTWRPVLRSRRLDPVRAALRGRDYLHEEIRTRVLREPVELRLEVQIAAPQDPVDDPSIDWPAARRRVEVGTLTLTGLDETRERDGDVLVFDPTRVCDGIELTDDPVLRFRSAAYRESVARRTRGGST